jgi:hypothetical protein
MTAKISPDAINKLREQYLAGRSYNQLCKDTGLCKATISRYCRDLVKHPEPRPEPVIAKVSHPKTVVVRKAPDLRNKNHILTAKDVIEIRKQVRETGRKNLSGFATQFKVAVATISHAISGVTFKDVNAIEPPIGYMPLPKKTKRSTSVAPEHLVKEALELRRSDPLTWTYGNLARWLNERTGRKYGAGPVAQLLLRRDPSLKALEEIRPPVAPKPAPKPRPQRAVTRAFKMPPAPVYHSNTCVICENSFKSLDKDAELCWRRECHHTLYVENAGADGELTLT